MNNIEKEPIKREFTRAELMAIHRALISEHIYSCLPPIDNESLKTVSSACQKVVNLISTYDDTKHECNE